MRSSACVLAILLVAGCATRPDESLVWSAQLARSLPRERGDVVEVARFSRSPPGAIGKPWEPYLVLRGNVPVLEWRWRVPPDPDTRLEISSRASPLVRLSLAFHGDPAELDFDDRTRLRLAKLLTVNGLPYASLLYVWMYDVPAETVVHSSHTGRVRMIVVEIGAQRIGEWVSIRRNVLEDYRRAFGEEPSDVLAVGLMTDPGDDGSRRRSFYGDITFRSDK